ncbi:RNA polymerase sigma factor [Thalassospira sp. MA62]|nr:RNA polymerase sigma factor [Thalassospira sp. MA62]
MPIHDAQDVLLNCYTQQRSALQRFLVRRVKDHDAAEELTQETWLRVMRREGSEYIGNPRAYLFRIASNLSLDYLRGARHRVEVAADDAMLETTAADEPTPEDITLARRELEHLAGLLDGMPPRCREVFVLAKVEGRKYAEISEMLGISRNTVISYVVDAMKFLEKSW